jgi:hypothetical protein
MDRSDQKILAQLEKEKPHQRSCRLYGKTWVIDADDLKYFQKFMVPVPTVCPHCSLINKLIFRNERALYKRQCSATGKEIISVISPDKPYVVYDKDYWWSDEFDAKKYGQDYDSSRPFFEQFGELLLKTPYLGIMQTNNQNSDYTNHANDDKNCYLISLAIKNEDCYFGRNVMNCRHCVDSLDLEKCEECYQCIGGVNNNSCGYLFNSQNCFDCRFSEGLIGCQNCTLCFNLRSKQYCWAGEQLTKDEYEKRWVSMTFEEKHEKFFLMRQTRVVKPVDIEGSENCSGDKIYNCKNCRECFGIVNGENGKYVYDSVKFATVYDSYSAGNGVEMFYNTPSSSGGYWQIGTFACISSSQVYYSFLTMFSKNMFGCVGIKRDQFCVLNKKYSPAEYGRLVEKIKMDMQDRGEFGNYLPREICPYGYNESVAGEFFPLSREKAMEKGFKWSDYEAEGNYNGPWYDPLPVKEYFSEEKTKELMSGVLKCEVTGKPFRIIGPELSFYLKYGIPIPRKSPDQRHIERMALKNPYKLWQRQCMCEGQLAINNEQLAMGTCTHQGRCTNEFETTYAPERTEKVYCQECYRKSVT